MWTGPWGPDDEVTLLAWNAMLCKGFRTVANGGSDLHGVNNAEGFAVGKPTTVVYADRLATREVVAALRAGHCFITRRPDGVEVYLTARRPGQIASTGGSVWGAIGDTVAVAVRVRRGGGKRPAVWANGAVVDLRTLDSDDQTVEIQVPIPATAGHVRAVVRGAPSGLEGDMEAISNPIFLLVGDVPAGYQPREFPVPTQPGPHRIS